MSTAWNDCFFSEKRFFLNKKGFYICTAIKQNGEVAQLVRARDS